MKKKQLAVTTFSKHYNCAQSVFSVFAEELGLNNETALEIATPFGGGMGRMQETCGAVTGAFMALGLKFGKSADNEDHLKQFCYHLVNEFKAEFEKQNRSINCRQILGYDMGTEEGAKAIREKDLFNTICVKCIEDAVEITQNLLNKKVD